MFGAPFLPNQWRDTSLDDFNATYYIMWDDENLYVAMSCQDDEYVWSGPLCNRADCLQFTLGQTSNDQYIPTVAARDPNGKPSANNVFQTGTNIWNQYDLFQNSDVLYSGHVDDDTQDWSVELKIPWIAMIGDFHRDLANGDTDGDGKNVFPPEVGDQVGFTLQPRDWDYNAGVPQLQLSASNAARSNAARAPWQTDRAQETLTFIERPDSFNSVENLLYVDGIFTPGRAPNPCRISTQGHTFVAHPDSHASLPGAIMTGWPYEELPFADPRDGAKGAPPAGTACLSMWGSQGITFDLDRIRQDLVGIQIDRFTARAGIANGQGTDRIDTDLWVLVDGVVRFVQKSLPLTETIDIEVSLDAQARFMTLITTARDTTPMSSNENWYVFQDPVLELSRRP
jgi:hypothetical protein